jgi:signal transduction histidine kinase/DNA-binding response OmpR family regulator
MERQGRVKILVVDDRAAQRMALAAALAELDEDVIAVSSGADALRLLLDNDVAVILLDVNMPDMDGFETAALIRQRPRTRHTPIIFFTGDTDELLSPRAYALGAVDFIRNPFLPDVLRAKVRVFVELSKLHERVRREAEQRIALSQAEAARAVAEEESRRLGFLAEMGAILGRSLDTPTMVREMLDLFVPRLADLAAVALADGAEGPSWRAVEGAGSDALRSAVEAAIGRAMAEGRIEALAGTAPPLRGVVLPLVARGRTVGALAAALTVSARDYAEDDLELLRIVANRAALSLDNSRLYREIQDRDRQKDEFLAMLSHELRNPLGAITTAVHLLEGVNFTDGRALKARDVLARQTSHLARIVDDLLDVAQVTTGRVTLERVAVDLRELVEQALDTLRVSGRLGDHRVTARLQTVMVDVDAVRTVQIISNILVNAVKYTDPGGTIDLELFAEGTHAVLRVKDSGIGMSPDMIQRLFQPFSQEHQALDRARGGLGLGLTLVRRLVELQDGHVDAQSEGRGRGSTFTVRLPLAMPAIRPRPDAPDDLRGSGALRILVVEDRSDAREMLRTLLVLSGHEVYEAADGAEGVRLACELKPQVALIDLGLPEVDGLQVASRIRASAGGDEIMLVALTGYGQPQDRQRTRDAGFDRHVVKPVGMDALREVLALAAARFAPRDVVQ